MFSYLLLSVKRRGCCQASPSCLRSPLSRFIFLSPSRFLSLSLYHSLSLSISLSALVTLSLSLSLFLYLLSISLSFSLSHGGGSAHSYAYSCCQHDLSRSSMPLCIVSFRRVALRALPLSLSLSFTTICRCFICYLF